MQVKGNIMNKIAGIAGAIVAVAVSAGVARATVTPATTTPVVYHACVQNYGTLSRTVSHVATTAVTCPAGTSPVSWNQTGPRGPQGLTGPVGPSTAGPAGLDVTTVRVDTTGIGRAEVRCPLSHPYVIGGGGGMYGFYASVESSMPKWITWDLGNKPVQPNGWGVYEGGSYGGGTESAYVYAICAR